MFSSIKTTVLAGSAFIATVLITVLLSRNELRNPPEVESDGQHSTTLPQRQDRVSMRAQNHPSEKIKRCCAAGDIVGMQTVASKWFADDPVAVRDWLETQKSLNSLQPVLIQIIKDISAAGSPADALKWAELLETGPDRDQTLFEIYATGRRYRSLSDEEIRAAPFSSKQIDDLLSGAADD